MLSMSESATAEAIRDYSRLSRDEIALIKQLAKTGKTQDQIAQIVGCSQPTVSKWLEIVIDPIEDAKHILRTNAPRLAQRVVKDADVDQSLEVLDRLEVAPKRQMDSNRIGLQVNVGMPGLAVGCDPLITSTFASEVSTVSQDIHRLSAETGSDK